MLYRPINILILFVFTIIAIAAQEDLSRFGVELNEKFTLSGLEPGTVAPDFTQWDNHGKKVNLYKELESNAVVLIFYRGYWCPVCSRHLESFEKELFKLKEKGIQVYAITPERDEYIKRTVAKTSLSIPVISDRDLSIMVAYKVAFSVTEDYQHRILERLKASIAETNGMEDAVLPVPASYLIGKDKKIKFVHFDPNYRNRASVDDILEVVKS